MLEGQSRSLNAACLPVHVRLIFPMQRERLGISASNAVVIMEPSFGGSAKVSMQRYPKPVGKAEGKAGL